MDGEIEAIAGMATGAGGQPLRPADCRTPARDGHCLNCGQATAGRFCAECGQPTHLHRSLAHVAEEFLHGLWHFDSRAWRTLPKLAFDPGGLTRDYVWGKRGRYIAPLTLFLLTIFVMFFVFGLSPGGDGGARMVSINTKIDGRDITPEQIGTVAEAGRVLAELDRRLVVASAKPPGEARDAETLTLRITRSAFQARRDALAARAAGRGDADVEAPWAAAVRESVRSGQVDVNAVPTSLRANIRHALLNPEFTLYRMLQKGYKLSFLLVPMSLPWMLLLFARRRDTRTYDHVVFLLYSQSFMAMLVVGVALLELAGVTWPAVYLLLITAVPPLHIYRQLTGAYQLSRAAAAWRAALLTLLALVTFGAYFAFIIALGLLE